MKVLFDCVVPFSFAHGGQQIQIEQTKQALEKLGLQVEPLRWWDEQQSGDILHYFGRPPLYFSQLAQKKGLKVVIADLLSAQGSRTFWRRKAQKFASLLLSRLLPIGLLGSMGRVCLGSADACISLTPWEAQLLVDIYGVSRGKVHVVPNGVEEVFLNGVAGERGKWLVCTATITERKRVAHLAEAAARAKVPIWIIGKPYNEGDAYLREFMGWVNCAPEFVRFEGPIDDRCRIAQVYREARGFVLLSAVESLSLSALEAAACGCPLLLSDLPWAKSVFKNMASYCPVTGSVERTESYLRDFYNAAPKLPVPPKPLTWLEVAKQLHEVYQGCLRGDAPYS